MKPQDVFGGFGLAAIKREGESVNYDPPEDVPAFQFPSFGMNEIGLRGSMIFAVGQPRSVRELMDFGDRLCEAHDREADGRRCMERHIFGASCNLAEARPEMVLCEEIWRQLLCVYEPWLGMGDRRPFIEWPLTKPIVMTVPPMGRNFDRAATARELRVEILLWGWGR